jgi:hypothetical protein
MRRPTLRVRGARNRDEAYVEFCRAQTWELRCRLAAERATDANFGPRLERAHLAQQRLIAAETHLADFPEP